MSDTRIDKTEYNSRVRATIDTSLKHPVLFFFSSGAVWLAVALVLGVVASFKVHNPEFLSDLGRFNTGRVYAAHLNVLIYGWAFQAAFAVMAWLMARLSRRESQNNAVIIIAGHLWNFTTAIGLIGIFTGKSTGVPWMEFPQTCWVMYLIAYLLIVSWSFVQFRTREGGHVYITQWYVLAAMFLFPWIYITTNLFVFVVDVNPLMASAINSWFKSTLMLLFFIPIAIGAAYYITPKVTGRPVYSYGLALFGFWALMVIAPWSGMQKLTGAPIPVFLPYVGAGASILFLIPALTVGINILKTMSGYGDKISMSPSLRFVAASVMALVVMGFLSLLLNLTPILKITQFSLSGYGYEMLGLYGVFTLCMFGAAYFIIPRITMREWASKGLIKFHFWGSIYGVIAIILLSILGGFQQGAAQEGWDQPWMTAATSTYAYQLGNTMALLFLLFSSLAFSVHLLIMWAGLGRKSSHPTLLVEKHGGNPHGLEGKLAN